MLESNLIFYLIQRMVWTIQSDLIPKTVFKQTKTILIVDSNLTDQTDQSDFLNHGFNTKSTQKI